MVTISLAGLCSLCMFSLCTGEKKLLMSFIPDPVFFRCWFRSFSPGGLFWPSFSVATWFSGLRFRKEPKISSSLGWMYSSATSCLYLSIISRLDTVPGEKCATWEFFLLPFKVLCFFLLSNPF